MTDPVTEHLLAALRLLKSASDRPGCAAAIELALSLANPKTHFGELLAERRARAGLTIPELAVLTKLKANTLRNHEGAHTVPARDSLARLLAVPQLQLGVAEHLEPAAPPPAPRGLRANAHFTKRYDPTGMAQDLRAVVNGPGGTLEQSYLYLDNQSAADYLAVCDAYGSTRHRLFAELQTLAMQIHERLDVVAIGSGDVRAEVCLAQALAQRGLIAQLYLLDISHSLLARAYEHAELALHPLGVEVEAVHGNFHEFQRYKVLHGGAGGRHRLYTLLGATIANLADELRFFRDLHGCSAPGDLAVIDFQLAHDPPESDPTLKAGAVPQLFLDWGTGPLLRNNPSVRGVTLSPLLTTGHLPGSYIIFQIASATMADGTTQTYRVMNSTRYRLAELSQALASTGWATRHAAPYDERTALMLLQRT